MLHKRLTKTKRHKQVHYWFRDLVSIPDDEISIPQLAKRIGQKRHAVYKGIREFCPVVRYKNENGTLVVVVSGKDIRELGQLYQDGCRWREYDKDKDTDDTPTPS